MCFYFLLLVVIILVSYFAGYVFGISGVTSTGDIYICLANGTPCPTVGYGGQNSINPRIVTPNDLCPEEFFPCYGIETQCGERFVDTISLMDGKSTFGAHPWQAYIRNATHLFAGSGALLDPFHILTAAHKVDDSKAKPEEVTVYMGVWDPTKLDQAQTVSVQEILVHPSYNKETLLNDIAVLRLQTPIVLGIQDNINTICVPEYGQLFNGTTCMVSGWGQTSFTSDDAPTVPQKQVSLTVVNPEVCRESFARPSLLGSFVDMYLDQIGEICAGGDAMKDACSQDGGSPLVCPDSAGKLFVAGLVIWGKNCGQPGVYGVYVNVPYYSNWISTTIESLNARYGRK